jgi:hypothetical protein
MRGVRCALGGLVFGLGLAPAAAQEPAVTAREILKRERCQTELPQAATEPRPGTWQTRPPAEPLPPPPDIPIPLLPPAAAWTVALVVGLGIGLALLLRHLSWPAPPPATLPTPTADGTGARPSGAASASEEPERLAREGRFAEAIHLLLLAALRDLDRRRAGAAGGPAWTSREVLRSAALSGEMKDLLAPLVATVERVHFGRAAAGPEDYASCAAQYRRFGEACRAAR